MNFKRAAALMLIAILVGSASAAVNQSSNTGSLFDSMWTSDLRGEVGGLRIADINNDGAGEIITSSLFTASYGKSGTIYGLNGRGQEIWKFLAGLLEDSYTSEQGNTVVGSGPYVEFLNPSGQEVWKRSARQSPTQSIVAQTVYAADVNGDGKDEAIVGTSMGMKGSDMNIWGPAGEEIAQVSFKGLETPFSFYAADLAGDGKKEIMVGTIKYSPNTVGGNYQAAYGKPSTFTVYSSAGAVMWSDSYQSAVGAVKACDINGDGKLEVITGSDQKVVAYSPDGKRLWEAKVDGQVYALDCGSLTGNGSIDVIVGAGNTFALDGEGKQLWTYASGAAYAVKAYDFSGLGISSVVVGSSSLRVVDSKGQMIYRSESMGTITSLDVGRLSTTQDVSIVVASADHKVRAVDATRYMQVTSADRYYLLADQAYKANDYNLTTYFAQQARELYELAGKNAERDKSATLIDKAGKYSNGDNYYNMSIYYFGIGDYADAIQYADKASDEYKRVNDLHKITDLEEIKRKSQLIPNAETYMNTSRDLFSARDFVRAADAASKARTAYLALGNDTLVKEADGIIAKSQIYLNYSAELDEAYKYVQAKNYGNASLRLSLARTQYLKLNDTALLPQYENLTAMNEATKRDKDVVVYGGIGVVALIVLLILVAIVLLAVYIFQKGGLKALGKMFEGRGPGYSAARRDAGGAGLRGLRGKTGESIGDSFKR